MRRWTFGPLQPVLGIFALYLSVAVPDGSALSAESGSDVFADNTVHYVASNDAERRFVEVLSGDLRTGYANRKLDKIKPYLSKDFRYALIAEGNTLREEDRREFLDNRSYWGASDYSINIRYNISSITRNKAAGTYSAVFRGAYIGKYFTSRFLEAVEFRVDISNLKILNHVRIPVFPGRPELYDVKVFLAEPSDTFMDNFPEEAAFYGGDTIVDDYLSNNGLEAVPTDNQRASVLFIFREAPPVGAQITIEHSWIGEGHPPSKSFTYTVDEYRPYFVIENSTWVGCCTGDSVILEVQIDGNTVERKDLPVH